MTNKRQRHHADVQVLPEPELPREWQKVSDDRWVYLRNNVARGQIVDHGSAFVVRLYAGRDASNFDVWLDGRAHADFETARADVERHAQIEPWKGQVVE